mmetsp:Transcript_19927/g.76435  ORF Transcript_19927/g.76435 Transcript_19927/m.76435 type:complete len:242 (+) Transcript_19927:361-1086(+)
MRWSCTSFSTLPSMTNLPSSNSTQPPTEMRMRDVIASVSIWSPAAAASESPLPTAITSLPTFGSFPATAVLTNRELTSFLPMRRARGSVAAPSTLTRMTCCTPSPLRTTSIERASHTSCSALWKAAARSSSVAPGRRRRPLAAAIRVSLVDWSPSTLRQLKDECAAAGSAARSCSREMSASVRMYTSIVARLGSTMPAPLATPITRTGGSPSAAGSSVTERSFGYMSVVMMPMASGSPVPP